MCLAGTRGRVGLEPVFLYLFAAYFAGAVGADKLFFQARA